MLEIVVSCLLLAQAPEGERFAVSGVVEDEAGRPVAAARVERVNGRERAETAEDGTFLLLLDALPAELRVIRGPSAGSPGAEMRHRVDVGGPRSGLVLVIATPLRFQETVRVEVVRAAAWMPVTATDLGPEDLRSLDRGQELPFLLKQVPSVTQYSDNGSESGYAYLYIRGIPQTRLNLTLDGVPIADAEDSAFYSVNFGGLTGVLDSVQVQRGSATSSFGAAPFAGSLSLASVEPAEKASARAEVGLGSLGAGRAAGAVHSGRFGPGLAAFARAAYQETDGYRDHSSVLQRSLALGLTRQTERSFFKLLGLAGRERQELAFLAVEEAALRADPRQNPLSPEERDRFAQQVLSAQYAHALGDRTRLTAQAYTNAASGFYRLYAGPERTALYQYDLDWRSVGGLLTVAHRMGRLELTAGGQAQGFSSTHARETLDVGSDYRNQGDKDEWSAFAKAGLTSGRVEAWADAQVRHARFAYEGSLDLGQVSWTFFNPRVGARVALATPLSLYASVGRTSREPARSDLFAGQDNPTLRYDLRAVEPETVTDVEAGADWRGERLSLQANVFFMEFREEIAQTGELSEIGLPLRRNVDQSHRRGIETEASYRATPELRLGASLAALRARYRSWTQALDVYDESGAYVATEPRTFDDAPPLLTPAFTASVTAEYAKGRFSGAATGRYVSRAHLDNTGTPSARTPGFFDADLRLRCRLKMGGPEVGLRLDLINVFDHRERWPSGYSYLYLSRDPAGADSLVGVNYFYPLAGRTVLVGLEVGL